MCIGELAELAGVTTRTVRHYHRPGGPRSAELLLAAVRNDLAPAQARCLELMFHGWQQEAP